MSKFVLVGMTGLVVNTVVLAVCSGRLGLNYLLGAIIATQFSTTWNFVINDMWVFAGEPHQFGVAPRYLQFSAMNNAVFAARGPLLVLMTSVMGIHYLVSNIVTLMVAFVGRYAIADRFIWRAKPTVAEPVTMS